MALTLETLQLTMMYHLTKFGCKKISSSADIVETVISDYISPHCDLELEDSKPIVSHDTLAMMMHYYRKSSCKRISS